MAIPRSAAAIAAIIALALTGCAQPDPNAAPTYTCTPSTGTPQPCYKAERDLQIKEDKLYAEAEAVYRKFSAEEERISRMGGADDATPILRETLTGDYLDSATKVFRTLKQQHATAIGGTYRLAWVRRSTNESSSAYVTVLKVCLDTSSVQMGAAGKSSQPGRITERTVYFVREADSLKIAHGTYEQVRSC